MRHSFGARRIIETNGNIHLVRDEMGHSSVIVTERYTRLNRKRIIEDFPTLAEKIKFSENVLMSPILRKTARKSTNKQCLEAFERGGWKSLKLVKFSEIDEFTCNFMESRFS